MQLCIEFMGVLAINMFCLREVPYGALDHAWPFPTGMSTVALQGCFPNSRVKARRIISRCGHALWISCFRCMVFLPFADSLKQLVIQDLWGYQMFSRDAHVWRSRSNSCLPNNFPSNVPPPNIPIPPIPPESTLVVWALCQVCKSLRVNWPLLRNWVVISAFDGSTTRWFGFGAWRWDMEWQVGAWWFMVSDGLQWRMVVLMAKDDSGW